MEQRPRQPNYIRAWREKRGLSLEALGAAARMRKGNLSEVERGIKPYTQDTLERLAAVLEVTTAELLARRPDEAPALWIVLDRAPEAVRTHIVKVAETMLSFRQEQPLDELLDAPVRVRPEQPSIAKGKSRVGANR